MTRLRDRALTVTLMAMCLLCVAGQLLTGLAAYNDEQAQHGQAAVALTDYLATGHPWEALFENWESEFLQMAVFVLLTMFLIQKGSPESRRPGVRELVDADPRDFADDPEAPWPVRRGGWILRLYEHSLGLAFVLLFLITWVGHALGGSAEYAADQMTHHQPRPTLTDYLTSARFWFESFQNWQSEFLAIASMVWLAVYLRQRWSPESKPVHASHAETGRWKGTTMPSDTTPYWATSATFPQYAKLTDDAQADVVVVGGGITGLTAAYLLAKAGRRVLVLERGRCAATDTGHTSAHLTMVTDTRLSDLATGFGRSHAQAVWDAGLAAIATIDDIVRAHEIDAGFEWVDGYLHAPRAGASSDHAAHLQADAQLAGELGFDAEFLDAVPLVGGPGVRFANQARIHPRRYLAGVAKAFVALGGRIHEHSEAEEFSDSPRSVKANGHAVTCDDVVIATHNPLVGLGGVTGATLFQTKLALYTSYVIAGRVAPGVVPDALWWDTADPYQFLRVEPHQGHDVVIFGGEDHKTGQEKDTEACYQRLEEQLRAVVPEVHLTHRWSGQVIETPDGLPYIGPSADHQYSATGYAGNGLTFGTLAGLMIADSVLGRSNPWSELFDPARKALTRGLWDYVKENVDYPYYLIRDRFAGAEAKSLRAVKRGEGKVIERKGAKVAAYRNAAGALTLRSAICTHMSCTVGWNTAERTWDCPCHGSRFKPGGDVISGPAEAPLPEAD